MEELGKVHTNMTSDLQEVNYVNSVRAQKFDFLEFSRWMCIYGGLCMYTTKNCWRVK